MKAILGFLLTVVVAGAFAVANRLANQLPRIRLRAEQARAKENGDQTTHTRYSAIRQPPTPGYVINFSNRDPGRTTVWVRSGPVEMHPTSTPVRSDK